MNQDQLTQLITVIEESGENNFLWLTFGLDLLITLITVVFSALVAVYVAKYQVNKSEDQQRIQREEEQKIQKIFMVEELKLKSTEKLLQSTAHVINNIITMNNHAHTNHEYYRSGVPFGSKIESTIKENNQIIQREYDLVQNYLSDLFTVTKLFKIKKDNIDFDGLKKRLDDFYNLCLIDRSHHTLQNEYSETTYGLLIFSDVQVILKLITNSDEIVRGCLVSLIESMQGN